MTPDREELSTHPVRLGRRRERGELDDQDERDGYVQSEVLDARPMPTWRPPRWLLVAVLLVAVVGTAGWYVDRQDRAQEAKALDGCHRELHNAVVFSDLRLMAMAGYLAPALSSTSGARHGHIADLMSQPARTVLQDLEHADQVCRSVSIRPWHFTLAGRHDAATEYSGALLERVRDVAAEGRAFYDDNHRLQRLRDAAGIGVIGGPF